jgi:iron complex transport system substrate-binding protein
MVAPQAFPRRIVCLTEETTETLYLLGEEERIVGVSGYTVRPPEARKKPKVSAFITARYDKILDLEPDLVLAFSDLQADVVRELIRLGQTVFTFNQRSIEEILEMVATLARLVGVPKRGETLVAQLHEGIETIRLSAARFPSRPRVFFEEWKDPLISGIRWVEELIEIAGGEPVFPDLRQHQAATDRVVDPDRVIDANPEIVIGSWCGRKVNKQAIATRPGWDAIAAVKSEHIYEIKSPHILQPGPGALTEGLRQLHHILAHVVGMEPAAGLSPEEPVDADLLK